MPFREKLAWLSLVGTVLPYAAYFTAVSVLPAPDNLPFNIRYIGWLAVAASLHAVTVIIGQLLIRASSREEARMKPDEREQIILRRGASAGYVTLIVGMIVVGVVMPFTEEHWKITNTALLAIVLAEVINNGVVAAGYRRQS